MGNLVGQSLNTQSDPALVLQQALANREKQYAAITNPQQQLAARLGGMLGGGLVNVASDKGFFDINDPLLNKVSQIQGVYNDVASRIDPASDPARFYTELQAAYSEAGLGKEALAAAQEAQKAKTTGMDLQIKEAQLYKSSPELLAGKIEDALKLGTPQGEAEAMRLANLKTRIDQDRELDIKAKETSIAKDRALIAQYQNQAASGKYKFELVDKDFPEKGWMRWDLTKGTPPEYVPMPASLISTKSTTSTNKDGAKGDKKPLSGFYGDVQVPPTDGKPRARGKMEQAELDALAERQRQKDLADKPRQDALAQGRDYWNTVQQRAQANGLVPQSTGYFGQMVYVDPRTGMQYTADQLFNVGE